GASGYEFFTTNLSTIQGGTILKQGTGDLKLSIPNSSAGAVTIENGKVILNSTSALPSGALTLGGGATGGILDMNGFNATVGGLTKAGSAAASANVVTNTASSTTSSLTWRGTVD